MHGVSGVERYHSSQASRAFGGIEESSAAATHPNVKRSLDQLDDVVRAGIERLKDFQHGDGGWGWWKPGDSDHWMTAYVVWGLTLAKQAGVEIKKSELLRIGMALVGQLDVATLQAVLAGLFFCVVMITTAVTMIADAMSVRAVIGSLPCRE